MSYNGPKFVNDGPPAINAENLNGMVAELEGCSAINDIDWQYKKINSPSVVPGGLNTLYEFNAGNSYTIKNESSGNLTLSIYDENDQTIQVISSPQNPLPAGQSKTFIANVDGAKLRTYFNASGYCYIICNNAYIPNLTKDIDVLRGQLLELNEVNDIDWQYKKINSPSVVPGGLNTLYEFNAGNSYTIKNESSGNLTLSIYDENDQTIQVISSPQNPLPAGQSKTFIANVDGAKLRTYFNASGYCYIICNNAYIPNLTNDLNATKDLFHQTYNNIIPFVEWEIGGITYSNGKNAASNKRLRTKFIKNSDMGAFITVDSGYQFIVYEYSHADENTNLVVRSNTSWVTDSYYLRNSECEFYRIVLTANPEITFTDTTDSSKVHITQMLSTVKVSHKIVSDDMNVKVYEDINLDTYSYSDKLNTLYQKWDNLLSEHSNEITKEVLATVDGKEMRCYTITPANSKSYINNAATKREINPLKILYVSSIHGNEMEIGIDDFEMFKNLVENHDPELLWNNCTFKIIPVANPTGYDANTRNNYNDVNINRNFPEGWVYSTDGYNNSGPSPASETETQVLMNFVKSNMDAVLTINMHNTDAWSNAHIFGYFASMFRSDFNIGYNSQCIMDTELRKTYSEIDSIQPNTNIFSMSMSNSFNGTFDRWFTSIGMHGYLIEYTTVRGTYTIDTDKLRRMRISSVLNLLKSAIKNNKEMFDDRIPIDIQP